MTSQPGDERLRRWFAWGGAVLLGLLVIAVFQSARHGAFLLWDDDINLTNNWRVRSLTWDNLRWMFTDVSYTRRYMPLAWLDWALDARFFGLTPLSCHLGNIVLHAANAVGVFCLLRKITSHWRPNAAEMNPAAVAVASFFGAAVWAVHPLRVEVVAWASGRIYGQATFFLLLAALAYFHALEFSSGDIRRRRWRWLAVGAFALSLLTYPVAMSFVGVIVVLDFFATSETSAAARKIFRWPAAAAWREKIPFVAVAVAIAGVTLWARLQTGGIWAPPPTLEQFPLSARVMQAAYIWMYFLWKPLVPLHLAPVYPTLVGFNPFDGLFIVSALAVVVITLALVWWRRRIPGVLALWLVHLALLVPVLGFTEHPHYANDRYDHLPALLWSVVLTAALVQVWRAVRWRVAAMVFAGGVITGNAVASVRQIGVWRDSETLFRYLLGELGSNPYRADIAMRLGDVLRINGRLPEAEQRLRESLQIQPNSPWAQLTLARVLEDEGRLEEAIGRYQAALQLQPDLAVAHAQLGAIFLRAGRAQLALAHLQAARKLVPDDWLVLGNLGLAWQAAGEMTEARGCFEAALRLNPNFSGAREALQRLPRP